MNRNSAIRVVLADDNEAIRAALRILLEAEDGIEVMAETGDGLDAVRLVKELSPDAAVLDLRMPGLDGVEATRQVVATGVRVVVVSAYSDTRTVRDALAAGAAGYVVKDRAMEELASAVRTVASNGIYISPHVAAQ